MQPKKLNLKVLNKEWISAQVLKIDFKLQQTDEFTFEPGQHISMKINENTARPYSILSDLEPTNEISIAVSAAHDGVGASYLRNLEIGDVVQAVGPTGRLKLKGDRKENLVFIATGTGVIPFITMFYKLISENCKNNIKLYFGVTDKEDIFYREHFDEIKKKLENFDYEICLSDPKDRWENCKGYVTDKFEIDTSGNTRYYVCGVPPMTEDVKNRLQEAGVSEENIVS